MSLFPVRLSLGSTMLYHGRSKLSRKGSTETGQFFEQVGVKPGRPWAIATGLAETIAGVLAITGIATRPAAVAVLVTQAMAIAKVHRSKGFSSLQGGFEFNLALMAMAAGLLLAGPGKVSAHRGLAGRFSTRGGLLRRQKTPLLLDWLQ